MSKPTSSSAKIERTTQITGSIQGVGDFPGCEFTAQVSPCSWMYPNYGVQLEILLPNKSRTFVHSKQVKFEDATVEDAQKLIAELRVCACKTCKTGVTFDPGTTGHHRDGECEACFMSKLRAEFDKAEQAEAKKLKRLDAKYKAKGCTHRVEAFVHPAQGDDFQVSIWMANPTPDSIKAELKKSGCTQQTDYRLIEL